MDPTLLTIADAAKLISKKKLSPVELVSACIAKTEKLEPTLNAYVTFTPDLALKAAKVAESEVMAGKVRSPMHGIPVGLKDIYDTAGTRTTGHSRLLKDRIPTEDAFTVAKLRESGAVITGKLGTFEFAIGGPSFDILSPPARNPWDPTRMTGGSSSGSGAAVAAGMVLGATGSDTGGSIRSPSSLCGLAGIKPTYGLLSRRGILPLSQTLDHAGPMCWTVEDAAIMLQGMAGYDALDPAAANVVVKDYTGQIGASVKGKTIGIIRHFYEEDHVAAPSVVAAMETAIDVFKSLGCIVKEITLPPLMDFAATGLIIMSSEAFSIHEKDLQATPELYGEIGRDRIMMGGLLTGGDYVQAMRQRRELCVAVADAMLGVDCLFTASSPFPAPEIDKVPKWLMYQKPSITMPFNVTGQPAMTVCAGYEEGSGLPLAFQLVGNAFDEPTLFQLGAAYEAVTSWRSVRPSLA
ncbi:MAG: Asp-tRNA(Asn)/Glu-tRNA(Gln) amidotransferase GatCAB subunit A [Rhizobiales bacterium PAR1]|nr:MAG: Asp-tRNA(Asn)/Glu-tRNA(Gln) amidotransferase GatCAB subunit A [Rhizobiales bacterium PAR1]